MEHIVEQLEYQGKIKGITCISFLTASGKTLVSRYTYTYRLNIVCSILQCEKAVVVLSNAFKNRKSSEQITLERLIQWNIH